MSRRKFLTTAGAAATAAHLDLFEVASSMFAASPPGGKPVVRAGFARPDQNRYFMGWPGADWDNAVHQEHYTRILRGAAKDLGVDLRLTQEPLKDENAVTAFLKTVQEENPDGLIVTAMSLNQAWPHLNRIAKERGNIPTILFSPVGTSFTGHLQATRGIAGVFVSAFQHENWLAHGLRMLNSVWRMKQTRLLIVKGNKKAEKTVEHLGTKLLDYPEQALCDMAHKSVVTEKVRAIADYYQKNAKAIIEPTGEDVLNAANIYVVLRALMEEEKCDGISINCLPLVSRPIGSKGHLWEPCLAFSRLRDEGIVAACEADEHAALSSRLTHLLVQRPGFQQDPFPLTVNNTLGGAHCACATRLAGFDKPPMPFILRSHQEPDRGVATQVLWPVGERMTVMEIPSGHYDTIRVGAGKIVSNIEPDPQGHDPYEEAGGCRTSVEVALDGVKDTRDVLGFHQLFILGDVEREFRNYAQLAGMKATDLTGKS